MYRSQEPEEPNFDSTMITAIANLLKRFGQYDTPAFQNIPSIDYQTLPSIYPDLAVETIGEANTWPPHNNAIVTFNYTDSAGIDRVRHSLVADAKLGLIVDSIDNKIKSGDMYGRPVSWASYGYTQDIVNEDTNLEAEALAKATTTNTDNLYTLLEGETIWRVARRFGYEAEELAIHNDIEPTVDEMAKIQEGHTLRLIYARNVKREPQIIYQFFDEPKVMHVHVKNGASKWSFGNAKTWDDINKTGPTYKPGHTFTIVGVAQVPIKGEKLPAGYYIDSVSAGDNYHVTNRPKYTTGFRWKHDLKAGLPELAVPPSEQPVQDPPKPEPKKDPNETPNQYKASYVAFEEGSIRHVFTRRVVIPEMDGRRMPKERNLNDEVDISGIFKKNGKFYGRPYQCIASGLWYGIPMDAVIEKGFESEQDDIYETTETMNTNKLVWDKQEHRFKIEERLVAIPLARLGRRRKTIVDVLTKIKEIR